MTWLLTLYWQNRSNSDKILPPLTTISELTSLRGPTLLSFPFITGMKDLSCCQWQSPRAVSITALSPLQFRLSVSWSWVSPSLLDHPITVWMALVYSILERTLHGLYITLQLQHHFWLRCLRQHFGVDMSIFTHSTSSPPFLFSSTLNLTAVLTQLKMAPAWLLPGCSGAESSDHLILISLLDLSAAFDRWTTSYF